MRKIILVSLITILFLPLLQNTTHLFRFVKPLYGVFDLTSDTSFTAAGWFSGKYQVHTEKFIQDRYGLKAMYIRTHNQVEYSLFRKPHSGDIVQGKNDYLFIRWYFDTYCGTDFVGSKKLGDRLDTLKYIQDKLAQMHKTLLIVLAPAKDFFYPEYIPDKYHKSDSNNYDVTARLIQQKGLNYIDFNKYFMERKNSAPYPLYSKFDSHWSDYGACVAGDSIINKLQAITNSKMSHTLWKDSIVLEPASGNELELEMEMNLIFPLHHEIVAHPRLRKSTDPSEKKVAIMIIGDSFGKVLNEQYNFLDNFSSYTNCYYYRTITATGVSSSFDIKKLNLKDEINKNDVFIIEATTANLNHLGWEFAGGASNILKSDSAPNPYRGFE